MLQVSPSIWLLLLVSWGTFAAYAYLVTPKNRKALRKFSKELFQTIESKKWICFTQRLENCLERQGIVL